MKTEAHTNFLAPRYWPTWLGLGALRLINWLPFGLQIKIGAALGSIIKNIASKRRHVTEVNIRLCFPQLTENEHTQLVADTFKNNGIGIIETAMAWWSDREFFRSKVSIEGKEYLDEALSEGKGVILLGAHYSTLDLGGLLFSLFYPLHTMYRPHNNPLMDMVITKGRLRSIKSMIDRSDFRSVIRALKRNEIVWYAPDQDFGPKHSVFAPFFGVNAATTTATAKLAKLSKSPVILLSHHRNPNGNYILRLHPRIETNSNEDEIDSATRINIEIEKGINYEPSQYMWMHRRFKSHPCGKNYLYAQRKSSSWLRNQS
ncbi:MULTISPECIES: LpxL/LpxP family Kdo(2)-lipid IV(A) lauroyl/palmitoleoyl acyltransferase [unclassified Marinobacterium]|uniref:LpxL/LpxP family Kdo(2)-lipid IV(A) lauroyl/palmitoleoyl acyltransferase n=1 Tax=unclassified Marinobacterium TaxID=2644139 RepID=UPI001567F6FA|nr:MULTISPECIES: LpxL/LpxP family Kdo(2)-lipid IV(A) lauroyl/palmitoleoyl acyltransferase [unclassified Marinobacterium]NRP08959.1 Lipid A biosynthesis lauroyl acyltransferase [Marinobacterium sp. xm-g-48]NRP82510.1 Lipid A biosynthesis lauroyl acyltransferase [Marinobacterium sp. xm-d-509]